MPTRSVNFTDHHDDLIKIKIASGQYQNVSEIVREAFRALELKEAEDRAKLDALSAEIQKGVDAYERGEYVTFKSGHEVSAYLDDQKAKKNGR